MAFARKVVAEKRPLARVRDRDEKLEGYPRQSGEVRRDRRAAAKKTRGLHAPAAAIEAHPLTLDTPIDEALKRSASCS